MGHIVPAWRDKSMLIKHYGLNDSAMHFTYNIIGNHMAVCPREDDDQLRV